MTTPSASERVGVAGERLVALLEGPNGPRLAWTLRDYRADRLQGDLTAGMALAALVLPLSIGYAAVAGLPPEMGLYASIAPLLAYALMGSSRALVIGPDAASASMIGAAIAPIAASQDDRVRLAGALGLLVAAVFLAMRVARLGFLSDLLSRPILVGYLTGVGVTVALGQLPKIIGGPAVEAALGVLLRVDWSTADPRAVWDATAKAIQGSGADPTSALVGLSVLVAMLVGRRRAPRLPMALIAMVAGVAASWMFGLQGRGVSVLGPVPGGLPPVGVPAASVPELLALLPGAMGLAMLTFADTSATGKTFSARVGERTDPNRELAALSLADAAASLTGGYPVSSSASRSGAVRDAGGTTQLAGIIAAAAVLVALLLLTGPLALLPTPVLGAVVLVSALGIVDIVGMREIWRLKTSEGLIALVAMAGVIAYGTLAGVAVAVLLATLNIVRRAAVPPIVEEGRRSDGRWHDLERWDDARRVAGLVVVRFAGPLFFASVTGLEARVRSLVASRPSVTAVVLDLSATSDLDITAAAALRQLVAELGRDGRRLMVARPLGHVREVLVTFGLADLMAPAGTPGTVDEVVATLGLDIAALEDLESAEAGFAGSAREESAPTPPGEEAPAEAAATPPPGGPSSGDRIVLRVLAGAAGAVLAAAVLSVALGALAETPSHGRASVPNLVGLSLSRASVAASDAGFALGPAVYTPRDDVSEGTVVAQSPAAGEVAPRGTAIQPTVSSGRTVAIVPDVVGQTEAEAISVLTGEGFGVTRASTVSDPAVPAGTVVSTAPEAGVAVPPGSLVSYVVSSGPPPSPTRTTSSPAAPTTSPSPVEPPSGHPPSPTPIASPSPPPTPGASPVPPSGSPPPTSASPEPTSPQASASPSPTIASP